MITGSTFAFNSASGGGAIDIASGSAQVINSTFYNNTVRATGGAISVAGDITEATIRNSTITGNRANDDDANGGVGGGIVAFGSSSVTLHNTLVAGNFGFSGIIDDLAGTFSAASSHNLIGERDSGVSLNNGTNGNIVGNSSGGNLSIDSILEEELTVTPAGFDNTSEFFLIANSPAVNAGSNAEAIDANGNSLTTDQFGGTRIRFGTVDIGARESSFDMPREQPSLIVTTTLDEVDDSDFETSLREAITFANNTQGDATITFDIGLTGQTITLDGSQIEVTDSVTIQGLGADQLTISGDDASRVFLIDDDNDNTSIDVTLRGLTIRDGNTTLGSANTGRGAGIQNKENLTLEDVAVRSNRSDLVTGSAGSRGGGLAHSLGNLVVTASTFADNSSLDSGGIDIASGSVEIVNSTFYGNTVRGNGAAIRVEGADTTVTIRNSTITGNTADDNGNQSNQAGGIQSISGTVTLHNTLVAGNFGGTDGEINDLAGTFSAASSHNLIGEQDSGVSLNNGTNGNIVGNGSGGNLSIDSILEEEITGFDNTSEFFLIANSPAVNAGSNAEAIDANGNSLTTDQFGGTRIQFGTVDIGSRESNFDTPFSGDLLVSTDTDISDGNFGANELSLREAIEIANERFGADTITFASNVFTGGDNSVIRLTQGELVITDSLSIDGSSVSDVVITGDASNDDIRVSGTNITDVAASFGETAGDNDDLLDDNSRVLNFSGSTGDLTLSGLTITGGRTTGLFEPGGGIRFVSSDSLVLDNITVSGNSTSGDIITSGGGIFVDSSNVSLINSTVSGNSTSGSSSTGGGISQVSGALSLVNSTISGNSTSGFFADGGGIATRGTNVSLINSTVSGNSNSGDGGGLSIYAGPAFTTTTITNSTISGNIAGRAGGGIFNNDGLIVIRNSTITDNRAAVGGGVATQGDSFTTTEVSSSIIAGNTATTSGNDVSSQATSDTDNSFVSLGNNLIGDGQFEGIDFFTDGSNGDIVGQTGAVIDPLLGSLADNGGPTLTHRLLPGSQAIDAGNNDLAVDADDNPLVTDQRGSDFVRIFDGNADDTATVDIGAFEAPFSGDLLVSTDTDISDGNFGANELSLREAIEIANERSGADTITFASNVFTGGDNSVIRLTQGELVITDSLSIDGSSVSDVVITGDASNDDIRVSGTNITDVAASFGETAGDNDDLLDDNSRVLNFSGSTGDLTLSGLTITGGRTTGFQEDGGGIFFESDGALLACCKARLAATARRAMVPMAAGFSLIQVQYRCPTARLAATARRAFFPMAAGFSLIQEQYRCPTARLAATSRRAAVMAAGFSLEQEQYRCPTARLAATTAVQQHG